MSGSLGDVFDFQKFLGGNILKKWKEDPERALLGINNPVETSLWGNITGKDYEPTIDMFGGNTKNQASDAAASGINTGPGEKMHDLARTIAGLFAGGYALGGLGGGAGGGGVFAGSGLDVPVSAGQQGAIGTGSLPGMNPSWMQYARMANMGSNMMGGGNQQYSPQPITPSRGVLMNPFYMPEFDPVYPGALQPFMTRK